MLLFFDRLLLISLLLQVIRLLRELRQKHPDKDLDQLIEMANYSNLQKQPKSRAFYRVQATRMIIGAGNVLKKHAAAEQAKRAGPNADDDLATCAHVAFEQDRYRCSENCGQLSVWVILSGGSGSGTFQVDYRTENGSASAGVDYDYSEGTLDFQPGDTRKEIKVEMMACVYFVVCGRRSDKSYSFMITDEWKCRIYGELKSNLKRNDLEAKYLDRELSLEESLVWEFAGVGRGSYACGSVYSKC